MSKYVALLRGINVGGNKKVDMKTLKKAFEKLGYEDIKTYINSGNVIFNTSETNTNKIVKEIEKKIEDTFGFQVDVLIRTRKNIKMLCEKIPSTWTNDKENRTYIMFLQDEFDSKDSLGLLDVNKEVDKLKYMDGAIVWHVLKKDYSKSGIQSLIKSKVYKNMTARNINTVRKLGKLMEIV